VIPCCMKFSIRKKGYKVQLTSRRPEALL
jgi:hypothetical protein